MTQAEILIQEGNLLSVITLWRRKLINIDTLIDAFVLYALLQEENKIVYAPAGNTSIYKRPVKI